MSKNYLSANDTTLLNSIGIDVISPDRHYWFVRTDGGEYFDDFFLGNYVGIQWNEIQVRLGATLDELEDVVRDRYPDEPRPGYVAGQIFKFAFEFKAGDIVLIPSKNSKYIAFGEILDDLMYIEDESTETTPDIFADTDEISRLIYKKRRRVRWIKTVQRDKLDPYLKTFIYAHNTIVDLNPYALFIDRSLSDFYVKGDSCFFSFRVNRKENIPYGKMLQFLLANQKIADHINTYFKTFTTQYGEISLNDFSIKINVQSEGPIQLVGPMKKALAFGLITVSLLGGKVDLSLLGQEFSLESDGIKPVIQEIHSWFDKNTEKSEAEMNSIAEINDSFDAVKDDLKLSAPSMSVKN